MKYRELYKVLQHRILHSSGFSYTDRSGWRVRPHTYFHLANPLNIIAVDKVLRYRFWINHSGRELSISYCKINIEGVSIGITLYIRCKNKRELAEALTKLFDELDAEHAQIEKGGA